MMNISKISFGSNNGYNDELDIPNVFTNRQRTQSTNSYSQQVRTSQRQGYERTPEADTYERHQRSQGHQAKPKTAKKKPGLFSLKRPFNAAVAGAAAALIISNGAAALNKPAPVVTVPINDYPSIYQIAATYDCDVDAIYAYNGLSPYSDLSSQDEIQIPTMYDNIQTEIDSIQEKLHNPKLTADERAKLENRMIRLQEKQRLQQELATVYTDGKYVYFTINELDENTPQDIRDRYGRGINVETFKEIFDIRDKAIRKNNNIGYSWGYDSEYGGYMDFTHNNLYAGNTIKVPVSAIQTGDDINLSIITNNQN